MAVTVAIIITIIVNVNVVVLKTHSISLKQASHCTPAPHQSHTLLGTNCTTFSCPIWLSVPTSPLTPAGVFQKRKIHVNSFS